MDPVGSISARRTSVGSGKEDKSQGRDNWLSIKVMPWIKVKSVPRREDLARTEPEEPKRSNEYRQQ